MLILLYFGLIYLQKIYTTEYIIKLTKDKKTKNNKNDKIKQNLKIN